MRLLALFTFEIGALIALHRTSQWLPVGELLKAAPDQALVTVVRLAALAACYWLLTTTAGYALALARGWPRGPAFRLTAPAMRRLVEASLAAHLVFSPALPVAAAEHAPVLPPALRSAASQPLPPTEGPSPHERWHVVVAGESLWSIAADHATTDIGPYWARLVNANENLLRSGDPDLIYPGERVVLPPSA